MIWLPQPLYHAKPVIFLLAALFLMLLTNNPIVVVFSIGLISYALWILFVRFTWRNSGIIE
jgi:multisubunit Na+/H+ antiporter MnhC subunit